MIHLKRMIAHLGQGSDRQIASSLAKECREFNGDDPVRFLRDLRDKCVRYSGSCAFVIEAISIALARFPEETEDEKAERRRQIEEAER